MHSEALCFRLKEIATVEATIDRLLEITDIIKIEQVFPSADEPDLLNLYLATVQHLKIDSTLKQISADSNVKDAWIHPPRKLCVKRVTMKPKLVLHHDDSPCYERLEENGFCSTCGFHPDMQSKCFYYYCPTCDVKLKNLKCPNCKQIFERPNS